MPVLTVVSENSVITEQPGVVSSECMQIRQANFPPEILFHTPAFRHYQTDNHSNQPGTEFVSISLTGTECALKCEHCNTKVLRGMVGLNHFDGTLFDLCASLAQNGARGVLISGGSDAKGRVPLLPYIDDLRRAHQELGLAIRLHIGLPNEETCAALETVGVDGAMIDIIGHRDTIREVYHLDTDPEDYEEALVWLEKYHVPAVPHIVIGLHYGKMLGEERALEMVSRHARKLLVLVILESISNTAMSAVRPPSLIEIGAFFESARKTLPNTPLMLGCARPIGNLKYTIDHLGIEAGLNGIAFPDRRIVEYARQAGLHPKFIDACCGVTW